MQDFLVEEPHILIEIIQLFIEDATANLKLLNEQASLADPKAMSETLHALKGSCRQIGGLAMGDSIEAMETRLSSNGVHAVRDSISALEADFQRLHTALQSLLTRLADDGKADRP